jgi:ADP-ribose pyrophosphatase YjhB (NUDIX family)
VAVDVAVLTVLGDHLQVVVVDHRTGEAALPGTFLLEGEVLADAAARALQEKAGLERVDFTQLQVMDRPGRDDRGWVLSVGHSGTMSSGQIPASTRVMPIVDSDAAGQLLFDHNEIVRLAVQKLRVDYGQEIDPGMLLGESFTVYQLRKVYQAVFGRALMKDTFRRLVTPNLERTGETGTDFGRPAEVFRRTANTRLTPKAWATFNGA